MKYTPEIVEIILKELSKGKGRKEASEAAGISFNTFWRWMNEDDKCDFRDSVKKAEMIGLQVFKEECVADIKKAEAWQAKAWLLERRFPEEFAANRQQAANVEIPVPQWGTDPGKANDTNHI